MRVDKKYLWRGVVLGRLHYAYVPRSQEHNIREFRDTVVGFWWSEDINGLVLLHFCSGSMNLSPTLHSNRCHIDNQKHQQKVECRQNGEAAKRGTAMLFNMAGPIIVEEVVQLPVFECTGNPSTVNGVIDNWKHVCWYVTLLHSYMNIGK